jgi:hypothetical protein
MKSRIEENYEQSSAFALTLARGGAYGSLPQATKTGGRPVRILLDETDIDALIRMRLKEDQRQDPKALQTAVLGLLYRAEEDLP